MKKLVLIIGAGVAGKDVLREINDNPDLRMKVVGFIDDDVSKIGEMVGTSPILGSKSDLPVLIKKHKISDVIIAIPSASGERIADYVKICSNEKINFRIVPRVKEIIEGKAHLNTIRPVEIEDLLGRPVVKSDVQDLKDFFRDKKVVITGSAGSIGSELTRQIAAYGPSELLLIDWWENGVFDLQSEICRQFPSLNTKFVIANVQDNKKINRIFMEFKPDYVFHAAAYKHVPLMEDHPDEAVKNNVFGTFNVLTSANKAKASRFVLVSTDKAADPISVMGATKLITESIGKIQNGRMKCMAVRFGNVLDSNGSVIPTFRRQIARGGPVTVTDRRMTRYFMTIPEASQLILKAASFGVGGELFVLDMGKPVRILDLAENLIRLSGFIPYKDIDIVFTGKRKGEKLSEKLFTKKEDLSKTSESKIYVTESKGIKIEALKSSLDILKKHAIAGNNSEIRRILAKLIASFHNNK